MKKAILSLTVTTLLVSTGSALPRLSAEERETIRRTLEFSAGNTRKTLDLNGINGFVHVTGYAGPNVELVAEKLIQAETQERIDAAKREVMLDINDHADTIRISVDYGARCRDGNNCFGHGNNGYSVRFDFEIRVPKDTDLRLRTVNGKDVRVQDVAGNFDINNVNGTVDLAGVSGSGRAQTVNGMVSVSFANNPKSDSRFESVNGDIEVKFRPDLKADLRLNSLRGGLYTDFPAALIPASAFSHHHIQVGNGGPQVKLSTVNGNIKILQLK
jgi:hypothetical protein